MDKAKAKTQLEKVMKGKENSSIGSKRIEKLMVTYKHYESHTQNQLK